MAILNSTTVDTYKQVIKINEDKQMCLFDYHFILCNNPQDFLSYVINLIKTFYLM